jgi:predicted AAA+ superfamily ATPase
LEALFTKYALKLDRTPVNFIRGLIDEIDWRERIVGIKGARGVGKTTLLLQYAKTRLDKGVRSLYAR